MRGLHIKIKHGLTTHSF